MTVQIEEKKKKPSEAFIEALAALGLDFDKLQPKVDKVFEIGRKDGLNDKEIGDHVRSTMKEHYSQSTIQRVLKVYPNAKQQGHNNEHKKKLVKMTNIATKESKTKDKDKFSKQALPSTTTITKESEAEETEQIVFQDNLESLMSLPKYETDIDTMDLINCRRLLKDAIKGYRAAKEQIRALNSDREQYIKNPKEWAKNQKMANNAFGRLLK
jgi:ATP-dependent Lon protease